MRDSPLLLVGAFGDDDLTPIGGADAQHIAGLADNGRLIHYSAFTVVAWSDEADFVTGPLSGLNTAYVIARGLREDAVVDVARSVRFTSEPSVLPAALPHGWTVVARSPTLPRQSMGAAVRVGISRDDKHGWAVVMAYRLNGQESAIDRVIATVQEAASQSRDERASMRPAIAARETPNATILAVSLPAQGAPVEQLAAATRAASEEQWDQFRKHATG